MSKTIDFFYEISKIPRESGNEAKISEYLCEFAKNRGLFYQKDKYNNVIIKKNNSNKEPIILQAHVDMVCEKDIDKEFDFTKDSMQVYEEDGYLRANGTTLGADNGIGVAQILNILDSDIDANIEAVFTVAEETTMIGAENIDLTCLKGKKMIGLDGFEENTIILESASFFDIVFEANNNLSELKKDKIFKIKLNGLEGGHSGFDIDKNKGNAIQELAKILKRIDNIQLAQFCGGTKFNVIPSSAEAVFYSVEKLETIRKIIDEYLTDAREKYSQINVEVIEKNIECACLTKEDSNKFLKIVDEFRHGVFFKNQSQEVTTSVNLGVVDLTNQVFKIGMRSSRKEEEKQVLECIENYAIKNNLKYILQGNQPGFETKENSELVKKMQEAFKKVDDKAKLELKTVHITVETGLLKEKIPDLEVAIISPEIIGAHTINERVNIKSVEKCDAWLEEVLSSL